MTTNPYAEWGTTPDPRWGYPRGVFYGQDVLQHLEAKSPDERLTYDEVRAFYKACDVSAIKAGGVPSKDIIGQRTYHLGPVVGAIRERYAALEQAARSVANAPRYVKETEFQIPLDWGPEDVKRYLLQLPGNTIIPYERAWVYLRICGIQNADQRLHPRVDVRRGPPGKEVGLLIGIIRSFEEEVKRRADLLG